MRPTLYITPVGNTDPKAWDWSGGGASYMLSSTAAIRINFRGFHAYPVHWRMRSLSSMGWASVPCNVSAWALCQADSGGVLPSYKPHVAEGSTRMPPTWKGLGCTDNSGKVLTSQVIYDISACDIIDEGVDIVYSNMEVFHLTTALPTWRYWVCVGLAISLVRALSHNIQQIWAGSIGEGVGHNTMSQGLSLIMAVLLLILVVMDGDAVYVTQADSLFFWVTVAYVLFYVTIHLVTRLSEAYHERPIFNVMIATLQLLAIRLYTAAETPYNLVLMLMLACRAWIKLTNGSSLDAPAWETLTLAIDATYIALVIELAYTGSDEALVAIFAVAYVASRVILSHAAVMTRVKTSNT